MPPWLRALFAGTSECWLGAGRGIAGLGWRVGNRRAARARFHRAGFAPCHPGSRCSLHALPCHKPTRLESCSGQSANSLHPCAAGFDLSIDMVALLVNLIISVLVPSVIGKVGMQALLAPRRSFGSPAAGCALTRGTKPKPLPC